jgi:hypothetical protein
MCKKERKEGYGLNRKKRDTQLKLYTTLYIQKVL